MLVRDGSGVWHDWYLKLQQIDLKSDVVAGARSLLAAAAATTATMTTANAAGESSSHTNETAPSLASATSASTTTTTTTTTSAAVAVSVLGPTARLRSNVGTLLALTRLIALMSFVQARDATSAVATAADADVETRQRSMLVSLSDSMMSSDSFVVLKQLLDVFAHQPSGKRNRFSWTRVGQQIVLVSNDGSMLTMSLLREACGRLLARIDRSNLFFSIAFYSDIADFSSPIDLSEK